jgi:DNA-binding NtrC family response regulator
MAMRLRRFDACVLPVTPATLGWTRTALACAQNEMQTPVIAVARELKAAAVQDLLALGLRDFLRDPTCPEELRVRLGRVVAPSSQQRQVMQAGCSDSGIGGEVPAGADADLYGAFSTDGDDLQLMPSTLREAPGAYHAAVRRRVPRASIDNALLAMQAAARVHPDEPFRTAKSRVVDSFERDYVRTALSRHAGNVARAARASAKHRRAFWALMRKHDIDAAPYRTRDGGFGTGAASGAGSPDDDNDNPRAAAVHEQGDGITAGKIRQLQNFQG